MEGHLNQQTGEYAISFKKDMEEEMFEESDIDNDENANRSS